MSPSHFALVLVHSKTTCQEPESNDQTTIYSLMGLSLPEHCSGQRGQRLRENKDILKQQLEIGLKKKVNLVIVMSG